MDACEPWPEQEPRAHQHKPGTSKKDLRRRTGRRWWHRRHILVRMRHNRIVCGDARAVSAPSARNQLFLKMSPASDNRGVVLLRLLTLVQHQKVTMQLAWSDPSDDRDSSGGAREISTPEVAS